MAGQEKCARLTGGRYHLQARCAIVTLDVTARRTGMSTWKIPSVLCGHKVDNKHKTGKAKSIDISARSNYNFEKPFLCLSRKPFGDSNLELVAMTALAAPDDEHNLEVAQTTAHPDDNL
ncbi:unnamed protein product [Nyctereutes procyonoides]|uniref:(raccoon dog) hypothetical protein n=1 Tax=Nyctereutes procyonoides TaxID=34880 RepID=A0A811ZNF0_NYCPR|nr:unnamed protein product [Nyctereutes procyonoides]